MTSAVPTLLAYLAGIIDADGTIGIKRSTYAKRVRKDATQAIYSERICLKQVRHEAVDLLFETFGGSRYTEKSYSKNGKPLHVWQVSDLKAANCARRIRPYLRLKYLQADVCLELRALKEKSKKVRNARGRGHVGAAKRPISITEKMENCKLQIKKLNHVGR